MSTDEYVPSETEMRHAYRITRLLDHHADVNAAFDRFLARVRRDAAREALTLYAGELVDGLEVEQLERFRDQNYPEEPQ